MKFGTWAGFLCSLLTERNNKIHSSTQVGIPDASSWRNRFIEEAGWFSNAEKTLG